MKPDAYTKFVLTVIAVCLVYMCLGGPPVMPSLVAQTPVPRPSTEITAPGAVDVVIVGYKSGPQGELQPLQTNGLPVYPTR
jgi:hypothetical protein